KIRYITWPHLQSVFMIVFILHCGKIMSGLDNFEQCYILGNDMVKDVSTIIDTYVVTQVLEKGRYSFASAVGLFKSVINLVLLISANRMSKSVTGKSLF